MNNNKLYSIKDTYETFGITESMMRKLILNKQIEYVKVGAKNFIKESTILAYINSRTVKAK